MLINNQQYNKFLNNVFLFKGFLLCGPDKGQVRHRANQIINRIKGKFSSDVLKVSTTELEENKFIDLINQKSLFSDKLIINLDLEIVSSGAIDFNILSNISTSSPNLIILESGSLKKNNTLFKSFSMEKNLACIPCYHDSENTIKVTINEYSKKYNLDIDEDSISYLAGKLGSDKLLTLQEIKKLSLFGNGKHVPYEKVLASVGDSSLITINRICDNLFNSAKAPYFYEKIIDAGFNNILVIRSLLNHFYYLLSFKENGIKNINEVKNLIHFSRHKLVQNQLRILDINKINSILSDIFRLEKQCKEEYSISNLLIKRFLISCSLI